MNGQGDATRQAVLYHMGLGDALRLRGDPVAALREYRRAADLGDGTPLPLIAIGETLCRQHREEEAVEAFAEAARLDARHPYPHAALGWLYAGLGRTEEAITAFRRAIELNIEAGLLLEMYPLWRGLAELEGALDGPRQSLVQPTDRARE